MSAPWAVASFLRVAEKWQDDQDVALFGYSRGTSTTTLLNDDDHVSRDRGLLPEVVLGHSQVMGRLSVQRLLKPGTVRSTGGSSVTAMLGFLEPMAVRIDGTSTVAVNEIMLGSERTLSGRADGSSVVGDGVDETWLDITPDPRGRARQDAEDIAHQAGRQRRAFVRSSGRAS